ncbi:MAG: glycoside hydrolase family 127 protein [Bacteroidaceae bacterium]|nr:glycoside hydrolase family 127 protein [Bacteroidaceae bacterium]
MKKVILTALAAAIILPISAHPGHKHDHTSGGYPITPVPFTSVKVESNSFWGQRLEASRVVTIPLAFSKCESEGRYTNFSNAAEHMKDPSKVFKVNGVGYSFDDTDPYKTIEGASYILQTYPDKKLKLYIDSVLNVIASAQEPDGYLYTARTQNPGDPHHWAGDTRWSKVEDLSHEFYNLGHMVEGAVAHYQATGSRKFLDIAIRYADCVIREVGDKPGQACVVPGHQIAEMALCRLYLVTGDRKYLDQAKFFLDYRGKTTIKTEYSQSHKPVVEQDEAVGHAVRATYMYAGMADVAALTGDSAYINAIDAIWDNIVNKKLYITGGIGATASGEAFGPNYYLPNMSAYCETCAAIGNVYVNHRLFLLHGESKYYDVLERSLYNGLISGVSLDGGKFFYPNPLESMGQHQRQAWFGCACCPSNISRFVPSLPGYVYAVKDRAVYVNLFLSNTSNLTVAGKKVALTQSTGYPYCGDINIKVDRNSCGQFDLKIRIPGWLKSRPLPGELYSYSDNKRLGYSIKVNGVEAEGTVTEDGYFTIPRKWKKGDEVTIHFDMEPRTVRASEKVEADRGMVSIERGPIVYCAEWPDNKFDIKSVLINQNPEFTLEQRSLDAFIPEASKAKLNTYKTQNITTLTTDAQTLAFDKQGKLTTQEVKLTLIPYYAWCHRGNGDMKVWIPQDLKATTPAAPATLASLSKINSSMRIPALQSIADRLVPKDGNDRSMPYTHWWPKNNATEWISYTFPEEATVQSCTVYWFDDQPWGGCRVPDSWKIYYRDAAGEWQPVEEPDSYPVGKGEPCTVNFKPVKTTALKLEVTMNHRLSAGVFEWIVK